MVEKLQKDREKKENLEKRRAKLKKLVDEENKSFEIEAMVKSRHKYVSPRPNQTEEIPTEVLSSGLLPISPLSTPQTFRFSKTSIGELGWRKMNVVSATPNWNCTTNGATTIQVYAIANGLSRPKTWNCPGSTSRSKSELRKNERKKNVANTSRSANAASNSSNTKKKSSKRIPPRETCN